MGMKTSIRVKGMIHYAERKRDFKYASMIIKDATFCPQEGTNIKV